MNKILHLFGQRVRELRKRKGFSQEALAEKAGLHPTYIGQVERGTKNPSLKSIEKIAKALEVSLPDLFLFANDKSSSNLKKEIADLLSDKDKKTVELVIRVIRAICGD